MVKIDHYSQVQPLQKTSSHATPSQQPISSARGQAAAAQANIDPTSVAVQQAFEQLPTQSEVDLGKVAAIRQAIADGTLQLDDALLAQAMLDFHKK